MQDSEVLSQLEMRLNTDVESVATPTSDLEESSMEFSESQILVGGAEERQDQWTAGSGEAGDQWTAGSGDAGDQWTAGSGDAGDQWTAGSGEAGDLGELLQDLEHSSSSSSDSEMED